MQTIRLLCLEARITFSPGVQQRSFSSHSKISGWSPSRRTNPANRENPNWSRKMRFGLPAARSQQVIDALEAMSAIRKQGRVDGNEE